MPGTVRSAIARLGYICAAAVIACALGCGRLGFDDQLVGGSDGGPADGGADAAPGSVAITIAGDGDWQITSSPAGIDCPGACLATFPAGAMVTLTAAGSAGGQLGSWGTPDCPNAVETCELSIDGDRNLTVRVRGRRNVAFMTIDSYDIATIAGLDGADNLCNAAADAAGLTGPFLAFLSSTVEDMAGRLPDIEGWVRFDGRELASNAESLLAGRLLRRVISPNGGAPQTYVSTTMPGGAFNGMDCGSWNVTTAQVIFGRPGSRGGDFFGVGTGVPCDGDYRLFCVGVDPSLSGPLVSPEFDSRRVFVTKAELSTVVGVSGFDATCVAEAAAASLPGAFLAMVASPGATVASRFDDGLPWARADGVLLSSTAELLLAGQVDAPVLFEADGGERLGPFWSGAPGGPDSTATDATTCANWTSEDAGLTGSAGLVHSADHFHEQAAASCNSNLPVVCAEL